MSEVKNSKEVVESCSSLLDDVFQSFSSISIAISVSNLEISTDCLFYFMTVHYANTFWMCGRLFVFIESILDYVLVGTV